MSKLNKNQIALIRYIEDEIKFWENTNDIKSPTHYSDIDEMLVNTNLNPEDSEQVSDAMKTIFSILKKQ